MISLDPNFRAACQKANDALGDDRRIENRHAQKYGRWRFGQIADAAKKHGIELVHLGPNAPPNLICKSPTAYFGLDLTRPSWVPPLTEELSNNKFLTKILLEAYEIPVPKGVICRSVEEAKAAFDAIPGAVVVKPVFGTESKGVSLNIGTASACGAAFAPAQENCPRGLVLVEEYVCGVDLRLLLLGKTLVAAYLRLPAHVVGDGTHCISQLIEQKNAARITLPSTQAAHLIQLGPTQEALLKLQNFTADGTPPARGEVVLLGATPNYIDGADLVPVLDQLHPDLIKIAQDTAGAIDADGFWGMDLLTEDFTAPLTRAKSVLCEANCRPVGGVLRYATHGTHVPFFDKIFEHVTASPAIVRPAEFQPGKPSKRVDHIQSIPKFEAQVAAVIEKNKPKARKISATVLVQPNKKSTEFFITNPTPSFIRGALAPWRWKAVRAELETQGIPMAPLHPGLPDIDTLGVTGLPIGRAFVTSPRTKMRTFWLESIQRIAAISQANPDAEICYESFDTPTSAEISIIAGTPVACAVIDYRPLVADGKTSTSRLMSAELEARRPAATVPFRSYRKNLLRPKEVLAASCFAGTPKIVARLAGQINVAEHLEKSWVEICHSVITALPGFVLGTIVLRQTRDQGWVVSEISADIDTRPFHFPDHGQPVDLAQIQAEFAMANSQMRNVGVSPEMLNLITYM